MKKTITIVALIIVTSISAFGQMSNKKSDKNIKVKEQLTALVTEFADALVKGDMVKLERILDDDYGQFEAGGIFENKKMLLDFFKANANTEHRSTFETLDIDVRSIRIYNDVAIIGAKTDTKWLKHFILSDQPEKQSYPTILTAIKKNGRWQLLLTVFIQVTF